MDRTKDTYITETKTDINVFLLLVSWYSYTQISVSIYYRCGYMYMSHNSRYKDRLTPFL